MTKKYFHTFDALRFFSFFLVFLHHAPKPDNAVFELFTNSGGIGVSFFFVLSGFLISYILMQEKEAKGKINLRNFFVRRILRIWPLFYAAILFAFLTPYILNFLNLPYSNEGYEPNWLMSLLFLENYQMMITDSFSNVSPLRIMWSLCIEEHFYITWGIVFFFLPMKKVTGFIIISLIVANLSRIVYTSFSLASLDFFTNIDYFVFGAIPAWWLIKRKDLIKKYGEVANRWKAIVIFISILAIISLPQFNETIRTFIEPIILGPLFASIILFTLPDKNYLKISNQSIFTKLGKYTYGLYLYHTISINFILQIGKKISFLNPWYVASISSLLLTILISIISYYIFEKQFLKLKKFFY